MQLATLEDIQLHPSRENNISDQYFTTNPSLVKFCDSVPSISGNHMVGDIKPKYNDASVVYDSGTHWPAIICPSSSPSTPNCQRLMGLGEPTSTSRKRTGHAMLKPATNTLLKLAKQELSNKPRRPSGKQ